MSELPKGWAEADLGDVGHWQGGGTPSKANPEFWIDGTIPWVSPKDMKTSQISSAEDHITPLAIIGSSTNLVPSGTVLFVTRSGILKHSLPVAVADRDVAINQDLKALTPSEGLEPEFIARQARSMARFILRNCTKAGTTVDSVDFQKLKAVSICLAPPLEQKRIVAKLDALSARSARARKDLARIDTLVTRYKQAVLSKAFSGELTNSPPDQWPKVNIGAVLEDIRYGTSKKCAVDPDLKPVLRIPNVSNGEIDLTDLKHADFDQKETEKLRLLKGDVLVIRSNGSLDLVGRSAVVDINSEGMLFAGYLIRLRFDQERLAPMFLHLALQAPDMRMRVESLAKSTSGVNNINSKQIQGLEFKLPPIKEQQEIVRRIESAFQKIDRLAAEAKRALELTDRLDEAILAKAFRGELVPQDPNDEPASVLLDRIRAKRAAAPKAQRGRRKKV